MACERCHEVLPQVHLLTRGILALQLCTPCLRQVAIYQGTEADLSRLLSPALMEEAWHEGDVLYLLRSKPLEANESRNGEGAGQARS